MAETYTNAGPRERVAPESQFTETHQAPSTASAGTNHKQGGGTFELYPGAADVRARRAAEKAAKEKKAAKEEAPETADAEVEATSVDMPSTTRQAVKPPAKKRTASN